MIKDLNNKDKIKNVPFLVMSCEERLTAKGKPYLTGNISDPSGAIGFRVWDNATLMEPLLVPGLGVIVEEGAVDEYMGTLSISITKASQLKDPEIIKGWKPQSYMTEQQLNEEMDALGAILTKDGLNYKGMKEYIIKKYPDYFTIPAARGMHHVYERGLWTHSIEVAKACLAVAKLYEASPGVTIDKSILILAALFHDIGKIKECNITSIGTLDDFTFAGELLGHHIMGALEILYIVGKTTHGEAISKERLINLQHCISAHHGRKEWGAAVEPKTPEALIVSYMDDISAKMEPLTNSFNNMI